VGAGASVLALIFVVPLRKYRAGNAKAVAAAAD
jgi:hypothetical protein